MEVKNLNTWVQIPAQSPASCGIWEGYMTSLDSLSGKWRK